MKKIFFLLVLIIVSTSLFGTELEQLALDAWDNSYNKTSLGLSKEKQTLSKALKEIKDSSYSISVTDEYSGNGFYAPSISAKVTYPEIGDKINISNSLSLSSRGQDSTLHSIRIDENNLFEISLGTDVSKVFDLNKHENNVKDRIEDLNESYKDSSEKVNFINNYLSAVHSILASEHNIANLEKAYTKNLNSYETDKFAGDLVSGSAADLKRQSDLSNQRASIDEQKKGLVSLKSNFLARFGTEYVDVTEIRDADLTFSVPELDDDITAYSVQIKRLNLEEVNEKIREKTDLKSSINLTGSLVPTVRFYSRGDGYDSTDISLSTSATYESPHWKASLKVNETIKDFKLTTPSITISGTYKSDTKTDSTSEIELKQLNYDLNDAERDYLDAVKNYRLQAVSLLNDIDVFNNKTEYLREVSSTHEKILSYSEMLKENNLIGEHDYEQAVKDTVEDAYNMFMHRLEGLQLEYKIKLLNL